MQIIVGAGMITCFEYSDGSVSSLYTYFRIAYGFLTTRCSPEFCGMQIVRGTDNAHYCSQCVITMPASYSVVCRSGTNFLCCLVNMDTRALVAISRVLW